MEDAKLELFLQQQAWEMARQAKSAVLGTLDENGYPYTSLVEVIFDGEQDFWLLLSNLASHTKNIGRNVRASLWIGEEVDDEEQRLASTRGSYLGRIIEMDHRRVEIGPRYLKVHPHAEALMDFADFRFYRLRVERARIIAGFGRIGWVDAPLSKPEAMEDLDHSLD